MDQDAIYALAEVILDAVALSQAMLDGDLTEARFRAQTIAQHPATLPYPALQGAATDVVEALGQPGEGPRPGYGQAIECLSRAIDEAAGRQMH